MSPDEALAAIEAAWFQRFPELCTDALRGGDELRHRLSRRLKRSMQRLPRAACLALRANDVRLAADWSALEEARRKGKRGVEAVVPRLFPERRQSHVVPVTAALLRRLTAPIEVPGGLRRDDTAIVLGHSAASSLRAAIRAGALEVTEKKTVGFQRASRVYGNGLVDNAFRSPAMRKDRYWGTAILAGGECVPDDFYQEIERVPAERQHPKAEKWGWAWVCPACRKERRVLLFPMEWPTLPWYLGQEPTDEGFTVEKFARRDEQGCFSWEEWEGRRLFSPTDREVFAPWKPVGVLACERCHRVVSDRQGTVRAWNVLVSYLTGGLLYGKEVKRGEGVRDPGRKRRAGAEKHPVRDRVEAMFREGRRPGEIAEALGIGRSAVKFHLNALRRVRGLGSRDELMRELRPGASGREIREQKRRVRPVRDEVEKLLQSGVWDLGEIARRLGKTRRAVWQQVNFLKKGGSVGREGVVSPAVSEG